MALLNKQLLDSLVTTLKLVAPVDTGNLRDNGIQGIANISNNLYLCQIGYPATGGYPATEDYAIYTQTKNKSSKGWVNRAVNIWWQYNQRTIQNYIESGVDTDELL